MPEIVSNLVDVHVFRRLRAGLAEDAIELLRLRRSAGAALGESWQIVHGRIEPGERAPQTALRELREETGLRPLRLWQLESPNTFYMASADQILLCPVFVAEVAADAVVRLNHEHSDYRWESLAEALATLMWPGERRALRELADEILSAGPAEANLRIALPAE